MITAMFNYFYEPYSFVFLKIEKNPGTLADSTLFSVSVKLILLYLFLWLIDVYRAFREITLEILASIPFPNLP